MRQRNFSPIPKAIDVVHGKNSSLVDEDVTDMASAYIGLLENKLLLWMAMMLHERLYEEKNTNTFLEIYLRAKPNLTLPNKFNTHSF